MLLLHFLFSSESTLQIDQTIHKSQGIFRQLGDTFFNARSLLVLLLSLIVAMIAGRLVSIITHKLANAIAQQTDRSENLRHVRSLRRIETLIILFTAVLRAILVAMAFYFWWNFAYPDHHPTAVIGASAIFAIFVGGAISPLLRDIAAGSIMMAEQWYGVGDHVRIEPFGDVNGIVERVTLRSTRIRGISGEVIWINNQNIMAVHVTPKGSTAIALEVFVNALDKGLVLIEQANLRLPMSPLLVASPLAVMTSSEVGEKIWHITAIGETAPGREWLLEKYALELIGEMDSATDKPVLLTKPIARYADSDAERKFARTIYNARKKPIRRTRRTRSKTVTKEKG